MRSRYVKKCTCKSFPVITKSTENLPKSVLDIELEVTCSNCGRLYKEVNSKHTRMDKSEVLKELPMPFDHPSKEEQITITQPEIVDPKKWDMGEGEGGLDNNGSDNIETRESEEVSHQEKEPISFETENPTLEIKSEEEKRDSDEAGSPDPVEKAPKKGRGRPPGKKNGSESVELAERPVGDSLEDCGVPLSDILA